MESYAFRAVPDRPSNGRFVFRPRIPGPCETPPETGLSGLGPGDRIVRAIGPFYRSSSTCRPRLRSIASAASLFSAGITCAYMFIVTEMLL